MDPELGSPPETTQNDRDDDAQPGTMVQIQTQGSPFSLNLLPAICPSPLRTFSPQPLLCSPCSPLNPHWPNMSPLSPSPKSGFGLSPCVLVPVGRPAELWCGPCLPARPWLVQREVCPVWCMCPQMIPASEPRAADQASRKTLQHDSKPKGLLTDSPRPLPSVDEETHTEYTFEEYMAILDSLLQIHKNTEAKETEGKEDGEREKEEPGNDFLEYLDELCSDEDFLRRLESTLDIECLDFLFSSDRRPLDLSELEEEQEMIWQEQSHPGPATTDPVVALGFKETPRPLFLDLPRANPSHHRQNTPKKMEPQDVWSSCSHLLPSHLLEGTPTGQVNNTLPGHDPAIGWHTVCQGNSYFMDDSFTSSLHSSPDTSLISDLEDHEALAAVAGSSFFAGSARQDAPGNATTFLSDSLKQRPAQASQNTQNRPPSWDPPAFESPSSSRVSGTSEELPDASKNDHTYNLTADRLVYKLPTGSTVWKTLPCPLLVPTAQMSKPEEQRGPHYTALEPAGLLLMTNPLLNPCNQTIGIEVSQGFASSGISAELSRAASVENKNKCVENKRKRVTKAAPKQKAKKDGEHIKNNEDNDCTVKVSVLMRSRQPPAEQKKTVKATKEQRKPNKKTAQVHPEKEEKVCENLQKRRPLDERQSSQYEEQGQGANIANTRQKLLETTEKEEHETQKIMVEAENKSLLPKTSAEKVQKSTIIQRITRSMTAKERVTTTTPTTRIIKSLEITSSPRRGMQDEKLMEAKEAQLLPVSSPTKRSRRDEEESMGNKKGLTARNEKEVSSFAPTSSSQMNTNLTLTVEEGEVPEEAPLNDHSESMQATQQQSKPTTTALETKTYNLRSNMSNMVESKAEIQQSKSKSWDDKRLNREEQPSVTSSPKKRHRMRGSSGRSSPMKKH